jgi:hypothetical protein
MRARAPSWHLAFLALSWSVARAPVAAADAPAPCYACLGDTVEGGPCHDEYGYYSGNCVYFPTGCVGGCEEPCLQCAGACLFAQYQYCDGLGEGDICDVRPCAGGCTLGTGVCRRVTRCEPNEYTNCLWCAPSEREPCDAGVPDVRRDDGIDADDSVDRGDDAGRGEDTRSVDGPVSDAAGVDAGLEVPDAEEEEDEARGGGCACDSVGTGGFHGALFVSWLACGLFAARRDRRRPR